LHNDFHHSYHVLSQPVSTGSPNFFPLVHLWLREPWCGWVVANLDLSWDWRARTLIQLRSGISSWCWIKQLANCIHWGHFSHRGRKPIYSGRFGWKGKTVVALRSCSSCTWAFEFFKGLLLKYSEFTLVAELCVKQRIWGIAINAGWRRTSGRHVGDPWSRRCGCSA